MQHVSWLGATPVVLVAVALLFLPGWLAARFLHQRGCWALAVAPLLTTTAVVSGGVVAAAAGVFFDVPALVVTLVALLAATALVGWGLRHPVSWHAAGRHAAGTAVPAEPVRWGRSALAAALGQVFAVVSVGVVYLSLTGSASAFPQQPDTIFHLGTVQRMVDGGDLSTLHATAFGSAGHRAGFYPAGFHDLAASIAMLTGASAAVACSVLALVIAALVWPLGCLLLARATLGSGALVSWWAGVASVLFTASPFWFMGYGVLWPNLLGLALLPAALALLVVAIREPAVGGTRGVRLPAAVVLLGALPGLAAAHPNAVFSFALIGYLVVLAAVLGWRRGLRPNRARIVMVGFVLLSVVGALAFAGVTNRATAMRGNFPLGPEMPWHQGVLEALTYSHWSSPHLWATGALVLGGIVVILRRHRGLWWVVASIGVCSVLYILVTTVDSPQTRWLTWPWYNNAPRFAAQLVVPAVVALTVALVALTRWAQTVLVRRGRPARAAVPLTLAALLVVTLGGYVGRHQQVLRPYLDPTAANSIVTDHELAALRSLGTHIPPGAVVAASPWNGANYLYLVDGHPMLIETEKTVLPPDVALVAQHIDTVGNAPNVCVAAHRLHLRYVITGGTAYPSALNDVRRFSGIDDVQPTLSLEQIAAAGPYRLFELTHCNAS